MQRKLNCVIRLVNEGTRKYDDDTTMYLDVPHLSAPRVVPSPFATAGPPTAPAALRVHLGRRHEQRTRGIQKRHVPRRGHTDFDAWYDDQPDNSGMGANFREWH